MLIILVFILLFHLTSVILLMVATINNAWWVVAPPGREVIFVDLWYSCNSTFFPVENSHTSAAAFLQTVQATMILAIILSCVSLFIFVLQLFKLEQGDRFVFPAVIELLASLCVMIGASVYSAQNQSFHVPSLRIGSYGSSFVLAWISFPMTLISGVMYLVLRKRK
ncbi:epithelial membrane protein 2 [Pseudoliparis swirei]|uniref:epithelial membrane protein 2 n=1 Tax=Pseudoliparis swirei TaxID=2059687 RepID=UPI0024BD7928|nr:epithelial membrane protein 2 [Pseudoliparis swirei]XP_056263890.1 epithelial membrane protein 2 [Pseudoliparis swirei]XP_056263891.1 epithelial membrane protein 2 [Pseudoliparis swirei]